VIRFAEAPPIFGESSGLGGGGDRVGGVESMCGIPAPGGPGRGIGLDREVFRLMERAAGSSPECHAEYHRMLKAHLEGGGGDP